MIPSQPNLMYLLARFPFLLLLLWDTKHYKNEHFVYAQNKDIFSTEPQNKQTNTIFRTLYFIKDNDKKVQTFS